MDKTERFDTPQAAAHRPIKTHWYDQFVKENGSAKPAGKVSKKDKASGKKQRTSKPSQSEKHTKRNDSAALPRKGNNRKDKAGMVAKSGELLSVRHLFDNALDEAAEDVLEDFDNIVQDVFPANKAQEQRTKGGIRELSHRLTDERAERRRGYMREAAVLSPYARYFMWWNLVRLTRLFGSVADSLPLKDGDVCIDTGSGPLTAVIALWLSSPPLRAKRLTWICQDLSQAALNLGEDLYFYVAGMVRSTEDGGEAEPWRIIKSKTRFGTPQAATHQPRTEETIMARQGLENAALVTCVNLLNEVQESENLTAEQTAAHYSKVLSNYTADGGTLLVVEPGVPPQAHVLSLMREVFLQEGWSVDAPCPHALRCPMNGEGARPGRDTPVKYASNKSGSKWCNFAFNTSDAPKRLLSLSADAGLTKRRAVMSFLLLHKARNGGKDNAEGKEKGTLRLRIASDPIYLPGYRTGYYACSSMGLALVVDVSGRRYASGDELNCRLKCKADELEKDKKTGAVMLYL